MKDCSPCAPDINPSTIPRLGSYFHENLRLLLVMLSYDNWQVVLALVCPESTKINNISTVSNISICSGWELDMNKLSGEKLLFYREET